MEELYGASIEPAGANQTPAQNPFDPWNEPHEHWLWESTPELRSDIAAARAYAPKAIRTADWAYNPRFAHIQQVRSDLLAALDEPSVLPRFVRPEYIRTSGLHAGPQIRFGHIHMTYDRAGSFLVPRLHWDSVDPTSQFGLGRHFAVDVVPGLFR
jgi:hypothetical protein